jgi:hypothetical protein
MPTPYLPTPDEPSELSAREQKILASIEDDLLAADPTLARHFQCAYWPRAVTRSRAAARRGVLLIDALIILIAAAAVTPPDWRHVLGLLTALLLVPWILLLHTGRPNQE